MCVVVFWVPGGPRGEEGGEQKGREEKKSTEDGTGYMLGAHAIRFLLVLASFFSLFWWPL